MPHLVLLLLPARPYSGLRYALDSGSGGVTNLPQLWLIQSTITAVPGPAIDISTSSICIHLHLHPSPSHQPATHHHALYDLRRIRLYSYSTAPPVRFPRQCRDQTNNTALALSDPRSRRSAPQLYSKYAHPLCSLLPA
ncbi:hypothetical protein BKA64DRAFT_653721 [Cadophora sp. MPI-SDFR-AT-0126]|nr:hypothetical protein BKA64DRAFT_653721 [Leotiomycetes sp. MPI-SDFR-AT-0126]